MAGKRNKLESSGSDESLLEHPQHGAAPTSRTVHAYRIIGVIVLLSVVLWTKLSPSTQAPSAPQQILPDGFSNCHAEYFASIPDLPATERLSLTVEPVVELTAYPPPPDWRGHTPPFAPDISNLSFCSVLYSYTHIGYDNQVNVTIVLPQDDNWNGRFQGVGGGGYIAGLGSMSLNPAIAMGWAAASTDGGLYEFNSPQTGDMVAFALTEGGNINWNMLHMFGIRAIEDMTRIGQAFTKQYYSERSDRRQLRSYWNGCSTGGRQGLMLAQRAPDLYDGILATAPALDYSPLLIGMSHAHQLMTSADTYPQPCEIAYLHNAAIAECDPLDGVTDGLISAPELCKFDPLSLVGTAIPCSESSSGIAVLSAFAAQLLNAVWRGPRLSSDPDKQLHPGLMHESFLQALINTNCDYGTKPPSCFSAPSFLITSFINVLLHLDRSDFLPAPPPDSRIYPNFTEEQYFALFPLSLRDLSPLISAADHDLSRFATDAKRPKMITWHGLADELIAANHSLNYYKDVLGHFEHHPGLYATVATQQARTAELGQSTAIRQVQDFYRYYQVPGVQHCGKGLGPYPGMFLDSRGALEALVSWVEAGVAPDVLDGVSEIRNDLLQQEHAAEPESEWDGRLRRPLCTWPTRAVWQGKGLDGKKGRWYEKEGWRCVDGPV